MASLSRMIIASDREGEDYWGQRLTRDTQSAVWIMPLLGNQWQGGTGLGYWGMRGKMEGEGRKKEGGEDRDWGTGRWSLCVQRTEHSTLVFLGVGNEKGLCRLRFVSTQVT